MSDKNNNESSEAFDFLDSDPYTTPEDYSDEYSQIQKNPQIYGIYPDFESQDKMFLPEGTEIVIQGVTEDERTVLTTKIPFTVYLNSTTLFALENEEFELHFQIMPSPHVVEKNSNRLVVNVSG